MTPPRVPTKGRCTEPTPSCSRRDVMKGCRAAESSPRVALHLCCIVHALLQRVGEFEHSSSQWILRSAWIVQDLG